MCAGAAGFWRVVLRAVQRGWGPDHRPHLHGRIFPTSTPGRASAGKKGRELSWAPGVWGSSSWSCSWTPGGSALSIPRAFRVGAEGHGQWVGDGNRKITEKSVATFLVRDGRLWNEGAWSSRGVWDTLRVKTVADWWLWVKEDLELKLLGDSQVGIIPDLYFFSLGCKKYFKNPDHSAVQVALPWTAAYVCLPCPPECEMMFYQNTGLSISLSAPDTWTLLRAVTAA